ncbi:MAG: asparagine synthase (glutamine-hydrolyzing) [Brumimicrobium sp.]|nr:asparagine synthase (glutamine-hydrolyzing) [Brumimicrobium sp.]
MCGIIGSINIEKYKIVTGLNKLHHRGPDAQNIYTCEQVVLGHVRLSIRDLNEGANQPFRINNEIIVFNGEIYNYQLLKTRLEKKGIKFKTSSDTEVLLQWLINQGIEGISDVEGMFAFAWYSEDTNRLILCRDQLGIKPLYTYHSKTDLLFCSEIKAMFEVKPDIKEIDESQITEFLLNGFLYEPDTGFKNIFKVKPGSYEIYDSHSNLIERVEYWNINSVKSLPSDINKLEELIDQTIAEHLVADVPVGLFFSGGIDSSIILTKINRTIKPITIKSSDIQYKNSGMSNDYSYAKQIADLVNIQLDEVRLDLVTLSNDDFLSLINEVATGNEEMMSDFTFQSSKTLSLYAQSKGYKVMLSGMGADELFAGYPRYKLVRYESFFRLSKPFVFLLQKNKWFSKKIERFNSFFKERDFGLKYTSLIGVFSKNEVQNLTDKLKSQDGIFRYEQKIQKKLCEVKNQTNLKKAMYLDLTGFLSHNFLVADKSSMLASLELRVPLATKKLFEFAWNLKDQQLLSIRRNKKPLRNILLKKISRSIVDRKKAGFNAPLDDFINRLDSDKILDILLKNGLFKFINQSAVESVIFEHFSHKRNNTYKIYQLLYLSYWLKNFSN